MTVILSVVAIVDNTVTGATEVTPGGVCIAEDVRLFVARRCGKKMKL